VDVQAKLQSAAQTLKETTSSATTKVVQEARSRAPSGFRQLAGFLIVLLIVALILAASNWAQHADRSRDRLWGELLFFALVIWFALAVLSAIVGIVTGWISGKRWWLGWTRIDPISRKQALAWAGITVVAVPLAILYRWESVGVLVVVSLLAYALMQYWKRRQNLETRVPLCYSVVVGTLALMGLAWASADQDLEDATLAAPTRTVLGAESLARQFRPLLFLDSSERLQPVDIEDATVHGCTHGVGAEECDNPVSPTGSLDEFDYIKLTGTELREGEKPGGPASAFYYHVVEDATSVYIDYWWYFAHNPSPFARTLVCGQALRWLGEACAEHPADWEGITLVLVPCQVARRLAPGCAGAEGRAFRVSEARYAQHDKAVTYPWEMLQERWRSPGYARWYEGSRLRPLVFVALGSHASYAGPCGRCPQIVRKTLRERRNGMVPWTNNAKNGCEAGTDATEIFDCLKPLPVDAAGRPAQWNAFPGRWGTQHCILFGSYCDVQRAPRAPSFQPRYRQLGCTPKLCITSDRL
jgi:hypothetical protein